MHSLSALVIIGISLNMEFQITFQNRRLLNDPMFISTQKEIDYVPLD